MFDLTLICFLPVIIITALLALYIRKRFKIDADYGSYRPVNNTHRWIERILLLLKILCIIGVFVFSYPEVYLIIVVGLVIIDLGIQAYMEFKHDREEKIYLISLVWLAGYIIIFSGLIFLLFSTKTFSEYEGFNSKALEQIEVENNAWNDEEGIIYKREIILTDKQIIDLLFSNLSKIEVRNSLINSGNQNNYYEFMLRDSEIYSITVYEKYITIDSDYYRVIGDNGVYEMLEGDVIDWKDVERE